MKVFLAGLIGAVIFLLVVAGGYWTYQSLVNPSGAPVGQSQSKIEYNPQDVFAALCGKLQTYDENIALALDQRAMETDKVATDRMSTKVHILKEYRNRLVRRYNDKAKIFYDIDNGTYCAPVWVWWIWAPSRHIS